MNRQIEEMAKEMSKELCGYYDKQKRKCTNCFGMEEDCDLHCNFGRVLKRLSNAGYQKVDKDKQVVLTKEEYDNLKLEIQKAHNKGVRVGFDLTKYKENSIEQTRKETAEKILNDIYRYNGSLFGTCFHKGHYVSDVRDLVKDIAEEYGVEVNNDKNK